MKETYFDASADDVNVPPAIIGLAQRVASRLSVHSDYDGAGSTGDIAISLLAKGGYNDVWLVKSSHLSFVLRTSNNHNALRPHQIRNEAGWLIYMKSHCPAVPVPRVYDYSDGSAGIGTAFIAMEYIDAKPLSEIWSSYTESEKDQVAHNVAEVAVRLGEIRSNAIGGMTPDGTLGPTVEGCKLFKGRDAFHNEACYDIGPYSSVQQYILAYYDKEIHYYSNADASVLDEDLFEDVPVSDFVETLKDKRAAVEADSKDNAREEPYVLCHNDLQGRNILMQGTNIAAVIDWEFAGAFPLGELEGMGLDVVEMVDDESVEECFKWSAKIAELVEQVAKERGWQERDVQLLVGDGDPVLQGVRVEMVPET